MAYPGRHHLLGQRHVAPARDQRPRGGEELQEHRTTGRRGHHVGVLVPHGDRLGGAGRAHPDRPHRLGHQIIQIGPAEAGAQLLEPPRRHDRFGNGDPAHGTATLRWIASSRRSGSS